MDGAELRDNVVVAKSVIEAGASIDAKDNNGFTALHWAAICNRLEIGKVLVDAGADLKIKTEYGDDTGLQLAERYKRELFVEVLRKKMKN